MNFARLFFLSGLLLLSVLAHALEIPLDYSSFTIEKQRSSKLAIVDIEKVFNEHPMTARLKTEFLSEVEKRKREIADIDTQINRIHQIMASSSTEVMILKENIKRLQEVQLPGIYQVPSGTVAADSLLLATAPAVSASHQPSVADIEARIQEKEAENSITKAELLRLTENRNSLSRKAKDELPLIEEQHTQSVLADIYEVLKKIAAEENLTAILDKTNILFGPDDHDITSKVLFRIQGR